MDYLHLFTTTSDYESERLGGGYKEPWVSLTLDVNRVDYNKTEEEKLIDMPLTFEILSDGVIKWSYNQYSDYIVRTIEYSKNGGEWTQITSADKNSAPSINVVNGDIVQFRGNNQNYSVVLNSKWNTFGETTCRFNVKGNIMSLIDKTNYTTLTSFDSEYDTIFGYMFNCTTLISARNLILPATTLTMACYYGMFKNCINLTAAPALPATTLTTECYVRMFEGCTSLTSAPILPATTLATNCYNSMFINCTNLNEITCLATSFGDGSTSDWLNGVSSTGTFIKHPNATWTTGVSGIPSGWTVENATV